MQPKIIDVIHYDRATSKLNRTLRKLYGWYTNQIRSRLEKLKEIYVTIHQDNLPLLMVKIVKTRSNLSRTFMESIFTDRDVQYNMSSKSHLQLLNVKTAK